MGTWWSDLSKIQKTLFALGGILALGVTIGASTWSAVQELGALPFVMDSIQAQVQTNSIQLNDIIEQHEHQDSLKIRVDMTWDTVSVMSRDLREVRCVTRALALDEDPKGCILNPKGSE